MYAWHSTTGRPRCFESSLAIVMEVVEGTEADRKGEVGRGLRPEPYEDAGPSRHRGGQVGVAAGNLQVGRGRRGPAPRLARFDHAAGAFTMLDAAMTPRRHASAAARAVAAVLVTGATSAI